MFSLSIDSFSFFITKAHIKESLESPFKIDCEGYIESLEHPFLNNKTFHPNALINQQAIFKINNKKYQGFLFQVEYMGLKNNVKATKHFFKFILCSPFYKMSLNKANRIYVNKSVVEVIQITLGFYENDLNKNLDFSGVMLNYPTLELISQYEESDLDFITRLAHNNGIYFYDTKDNIYFVDISQKRFKKEILFNPNMNNALNESCIYNIYKKQSLSANAFTQSSQNANNPFLLQSLTLQENELSNINEHKHIGESSFTQHSDLKTPLNLKEQRLKILEQSLNAQSNIYDLYLNEGISLHFDKKKSEFIIIEMEQTLIDESLLEHDFKQQPKSNDSFNESYNNILTLLPIAFNYTPSLKNKPKPPHSTLGIVVGENESAFKNTIFSDEFGRVKVRINCFSAQEIIDKARLNKQSSQIQESIINYSYSPFLRVSSPIASMDSGFFHIPRVGDEVIVSFFDEDIDKPYISGSLYNQNNAPLKAHQTSFSARTLNNKQDKIESGLNEITLSNIKEQEQIYLQAQRDYNELIKHNFTQKIQNNKESHIEGAYQQRIKKIHTQTIDLAKIVNIGGEYNINVALSKDTIVAGSHTLNIGASNKLRIAKDSSEYVGENKEVEIDGKLNINIKQDENKNIQGNKREIIQGSLDIQSTKECNLSTQSQININAKDNILFSSNESASFEAQKELSFIANNIDMESSNNFTAAAGNAIIHQVGDTSISINGDSVIIKAGGVEMIVDSNGLIIKGGEIRAE